MNQKQFFIRLTVATAVMLVLSFYTINPLNAQNMQTEIPKQSSFPIGEANTGYAQYFSGRSWLSPLTPANDLNVSVSNVTFEPACRNNWHSHTAGQILIAVGGVGYYQEKGVALQKSIFGAAIDKNYETAAPNQLYIQKLLSANCFGDYQTRPTLDVKLRELLTYSILISLGGCESQVKGHIQGNVNVGNDKATLLAVTTQLLPSIGYPRTLNAIASLNEVIPESN